MQFLAQTCAQCDAAEHTATHQFAQVAGARLWPVVAKAAEEGGRF